ncbi:LRPAP1 family protein [Megaselia abdita]
MSSKIKIVLILFACLSIQPSTCDKKFNKYSKEANIPKEQYDPDFRNIENPFRMAKCNLVWSKAVHRLTEPKLKSLYLQLNLYDQDLLSHKQSKQLDKEGRIEADLRSKLINIMTQFGLLEHFNETDDKENLKKYNKSRVDKNKKKSSDSYKNKSLFKDIKLNSLWEKAEVAGFTTDELNALKEEFIHHQDKIDVYYSLLDDVGNNVPKKNLENAINEDEIDDFNEIDHKAVDHINSRPKINDIHSQDNNDLRDHHRGIKDNIDRLERVVSRGPNSKDFVEPRVQALWRDALNTSFSQKELESLRDELMHYEARLLKLRHLHVEHALSREKHKVIYLFYAYTIIVYVDRGALIYKTS